tara:strand:- start:254 stop:445 length:192 start_codon:yes stop_codon:yes gene_type:complete
MRLTRGRAKQKIVNKKLDIPKVITEDLGYYMQFGFKRIPTSDNGRYHEIKHAKRPYARSNYYE